MYEHIIAEVMRLPWATIPETLTTVSAILARRVAGHRLTGEEIESRIAAGRERAAMRDGRSPRAGAVAIMTMIGVLLPRGEALERTSGAVSVQQLTAMFRGLVADDNIAAVVLDVDSAGGSVGGIAEFGDAIFEARAKKPIVASVSPLAASAAYWLVASASEIIATPSALVGSIGVFSLHHDLSAALEKAGVNVTLLSAGKNKTLGHEFGPLSPEARKDIQSRIDAYYSLFTRAVARGRGVSQDAVVRGYGEGSLVTASRALQLGMIDEIGGIETAIARAQALAGGAAVSRRGLSASAPSSSSLALEARHRRLRLDAVGSTLKTDELERRQRRLRAAH